MTNIFLILMMITREIMLAINNHDDAMIMIIMIVMMILVIKIIMMIKVIMI